MQIIKYVLLFAFSICVLFAAGCDEEDDAHALCAEHYEQSAAGDWSCPDLVDSFLMLPQQRSSCKASHTRQG